MNINQTFFHIQNVSDVCPSIQNLPQPKKHHSKPPQPLHSPPPSPNPEVTKNTKETKKRPKLLSSISFLLLPPSLLPLLLYSIFQENLTIRAITTITRIKAKVPHRINLFFFIRMKMLFIRRYALPMSYCIVISRYLFDFIFYVCD